jgi:hypothetical protein
MFLPGNSRQSRRCTEKNTLDDNAKTMTVANLVRNAAPQQQKERKRLNDYDDDFQGIESAFLMQLNFKIEDHNNYINTYNLG